jgi:hypothetical protein
MKLKVNLIAAFVIILFAVSCTEDSPITPTEPSEPVEPAVPFQELYDQGIDKYLGVFTPDTSEVFGAGTLEHIFRGIDAPICFTGNEFSMFTRDGSENNLLIFLQGGRQ